MSSLVAQLPAAMVEEVIVVGVLAVAVMLVYYTLLASPGQSASSNEEAKPMVRAGFRTKLALKFPPFVVQCREHALIVAGGGGDSNTGVPNQIILYRVKDGTFEELVSQDTGKETIFQIAFHPTKSVISCSVGCDCWIMEYSKRGFKLLNKFTTVEKKKKLDEQRTSLFVAGGAYLLTAGSDGKLSVFVPRDHFSRFDKATEVLAFEDNLSDVHANADFTTVVAVAKKECKLWRVHNGVEFSEPFLLKTATPQHEFKGARLSSYSPILYTAEILPRKMSIVKKWRFEVGAPSAPHSAVKGVQLIDEVVVYQGKHHTSFDMSACGRFLALGSPTGEVVVVSTSSMSVIAQLQSHHFTVTNIALSVPYSAASFIANARGGENSQTPSKRKAKVVPSQLDFDDLRSCYSISCALDRGLVAKSIERNRVKSSNTWLYFISFAMVAGYLLFNFATMTPER